MTTQLPIHSHQSSAHVYPMQSLLFLPSSPFLHNSASLQSSIPTFTDRDLMTNCLVSQFRCNHRNSHIFNVCLDLNSPNVFRLAFVDAMHTVLKEVFKGSSGWGWKGRGYRTVLCLGLVLNRECVLIIISE